METKAGKDARMQMRIYSYIYSRRTGELPQRGVIYSLGAIEPESEWSSDESMIVIDDLGDEDKYEEALSEFTETVNHIESSREVNNWQSPVTDPGEKTCDSCPVRFSCDYIKQYDREYENRYP